LKPRLDGLRPRSPPPVRERTPSGGPRPAAYVDWDQTEAGKDAGVVTSTQVPTSLVTTGRVGAARPRNVGMGAGMEAGATSGGTPLEHQWRSRTWYEDGCKQGGGVSGTGNACPTERAKQPRASAQEVVIEGAGGKVT